LRPGDTILEVDGYPVHHFAPPSQDSVTWRIVTSENTNIVIKYMRDGQEATANAIPYHRPTKWYERKALRQVLIASAMKPVIDEVATNSPAALAGLNNGDEIISLDGKKIYSPLAIATAEASMSNGPVRPMQLSVRRGNEEFERTLLPVRPIQPTNSPPSLGIVAWGEQTNMLLVHPNPWDQIKSSVGQIVGTLRVLVTPKSEVSVQQLGGAVMIVRVYYNLFQDEDGWRRVLWFSVILNVNLALLNLLPLPVLDGGHIVLALVEAIRRRPISVRLLQSIQTGFAALIIGFMIYIAFFDTGDWFRSAHEDRYVPIKFAPQK
jgi:regulator of sigma E protease